MRFPGDGKPTPETWPGKTIAETAFKLQDKQAAGGTLTPQEQAFVTKMTSTPEPAAPVTPTPAPRGTDTTGGRRFSDNVTAALNDGHFMSSLPTHLKPKIEKDDDGNEIVTIPGSLLNKIMRDMYSAGEENYQLQNMPEPAPSQAEVDQARLDFASGMTDPRLRTAENEQRVANGLMPMQQPAPQGANPYGPQVQMQDQTTPQAEVLLRELQKAYPGRTPDEIARILRGGK